MNNNYNLLISKPVKFFRELLCLCCHTPSCDSKIGRRGHLPARFGHSYAARFAGLFFVLFITAIIAVGCQGPVGPSGKDATGVDVVPPTIVLLEPWPLSNVWDELEIVASAVDNVAINLVSFNIDGTTVYALEEPPYTHKIDLAGYVPGWHFVSARAFDSGGNITDTPVIPINIGFSEGLDELSLVSFHNNVPGTVWTLPDSVRATSYWTKFPIAKKCFLIRTSIWFGAFMSDTTTVAIEIWHGSEFPSTVDTTIHMTINQLDTTIQERRINFLGRGYEIEQDFFIMISLANNTRNDKLIIQADNGKPFWKRSGSRDDDGYHFLMSRYAREDNLFMDCILNYASSEGDTTGGG